MPPKKLPTVWKADPHTLAKIAMLKTYLFAWFAIMGRTKRGQDLLYIDGFAGPGEYTNHPMGSPLAALIAAKEAKSSVGSHWIAGDIHCAFIEPDPKRYAHLDERLEVFRTTPGLHVHVVKSSFVDGLTVLKPQMPKSFGGALPLFVFADPFGPTGIPFSIIEELLRSPCSEVLINLDADGIGRIYKAKSNANHEQLLSEIFGNDSWASALSHDLPFPQLCRTILDTYISQLRAIPGIRYVFPFEMQSSTGTLNYFLVFASQHFLGLEKMKESMKTIDQMGDYRFADALVQQPGLIRFDDPSQYSGKLADRFIGQKAQYNDARDFALNETPFVNPKGMLKDLEEKGQIFVASKDPKRRKGTFNERNIEYIEFLARRSDG